MELTAVAFFAIEARYGQIVDGSIGGIFPDFHHVLIHRIHRFSRHLSPGRLLGDRLDWFLVKAFPPSADILLPLRLHFSSGGIDGIIGFFFNYVARSLRQL